MTTECNTPLIQSSSPAAWQGRRVLVLEYRISQGERTCDIAVPVAHDYPDMVDCDGRRYDVRNVPVGDVVAGEAF